jgi:glycosyltransferase involved in cell wall biosynthesis
MKANKQHLYLQDYVALKERVKDVVHTMEHIDVVCLPSSWEGFSNSISEAICCGRPVLVSDVADNCVMVKNGTNGFVFNPNDVDGIVRAFVSFFSLSNSAKQQMGDSSRALAEKLFDRDRFLNSYDSLFNS